MLEGASTITEGMQRIGIKQVEFAQGRFKEGLMAEPAVAAGAGLAEALIQLQHSSRHQENFLNILISSVSTILFRDELRGKKKKNISVEIIRLDRVSIFNTKR